MAFTDVFGGELIFPSQLSYNQITFSVDVTLQWSREQQVGGVNVVSDFMDMDATAGSLNVDMPSASQTGEGNKATFNNIGSNAFTVRDSTGGTIQSVAPGEQWVVVLTDNTTAAGTWSTFQLGASVSVASASALAGAGIKAISTTLNQKIDSDVEASTPFTVVEGDRAKCLIYTSGAGTCNLPSAAAVGNDWWFMLRNSGSGTLNVVPPAGDIDGASSINLDPGVSTFVFTDGTDWFTVGLSTGSVIAFDFVSIAIPGSGDFTLSGANLNRIAYRFTGVLTGNRKVIVPTTTQQYWVDNQTSGAFTLEIATAGQGSPPQVGQGESIIFYCDATDVINANTSTSISFPVLIAQGGTSGITVAAAQSNLEVPPTSRLFSAGFGVAASGLGDLSADRTINVEVPTEAQAGAVEIATQAETDTGADDIRYVTPLKLATTSLISALPQVKVKTADTSRSNDAVLSDDPHLAGFVLVTGKRYNLRIPFALSESGSNDFKYNLNFSNAAQSAQVISLFGGLDTLGTAQYSGEVTMLAVDDVIAHSDGGAQGVMEFTFQANGSTGGTVALEWSQNISGGVATVLREGTCAILTQLD